MKVIAGLPEKEGWHLREGGFPIQVGIKSGVTAFSGKHLHKAMAEYFYLLQGKVRLEVDGEALEMKQGDLVVVEPGEAHEVLHTTPDALILLLMPPPIENDKVELEEQKR